MSHRTGIQRRTWKERALSLLLAAVMLAGLLPGMTLPSAAEHWADTYLDQLVDWGVLRADQTADPDAALTRAEFMAIINRAYGYTETGPIPFEDVKTTDWFYDDVAIAYNAGYMAGTSDITASPHDTLTREQAVCILGRNMMMKDTAGESLAFADSRDVSDWARGTVKTAVDNYIISGYPDNTFHPKAAISKAQMAVLITQCVGSPIQQSGSYEMGGVFGNVTITSPNVTLRNTTISGDLYVSGGVGLGGIRLENVNVLGRIILSGTGESEAGDASVVMRNVTAQEMLVDNMRNKTVTIRADGITDIGKTTVRTNAYLEDNNTDDKGLMNIELDGESGTNLTLAGRIKKVVDKTPNSYIQVAKGTVDTLTVDEAAVNSTVQLDRNTEVKTMNLDVATNVTGDGDIGELNVNAPGCVVAMLPDKIYIRPGLTANIAGVVMDHQAAEEGSLDPRLLSGYPAAKDITPTGLRADFSGNKKGTVYWAVSSITDGSIGEDDLISPPSYGSKAIRNGSVAAPTGGSEVSAQITGLTVGGSYYLSAMLVDDQGNRSPVKVVSFSTPDNTVPAFGQGYPYMSFIGKANEYETLVTAQVAVMATKTCRMYYAVLPAGAAAPTIDELRSASVSSNLGYGVVELEKNYVWDGDQAIIVSRRLEEQKDYVLYMWLTDGVNSSAVTSLAFSTPDVTPPVFVVHPRENGDPQTNSVPLAATINENGTIFWVVVESGSLYPLPNNQNDKDNEADGSSARLDSDYAKLQVANGMNAIRSGRVTATANTQVAMNITGLEAEKSYDLYYLAQDTAGNYTVQVYKLQGGIRTRDTTPPTVRQFFTRADSQDANRPMLNTDIVLEFSENICLGGSGGKDLVAMYEATQTGTTSEQETAKQEFVRLLKQNINFFVWKNGQKQSAVKDGEGVRESDWAIDFTKARVNSANLGGKVQIIFPYENGDGVRLDSGATYHFEVNTDTSNQITDLSGHAMSSAPVKYDTPEDQGHSLPQFTVVFARVNMTSNGFRLTGQEWPAAIQEENDRLAEQGLNIGAYQVDFKFRLMPEETKSVAEGIAYDLLLWTDTDIKYDLYFRIVTDGDPSRVLTANPGLGMPSTIPAVPDDNGWVKLGNSGGHDFGTASGGKSSKRLHYTFNGLQASGDILPDLKDLVDELEESGEKVYYDFAVSVREINGRTSPNTWGETVKFYVDVAAGDTYNLFGLGESPTPAAWQTFQDLQLNGGGGESVGSAGSEYETDPKELYMTKTFHDSLQPEFDRGYPNFDTTEDSVTMNLRLNGRAGTVYYVIGYGNDGDGAEPANPANWNPTITTRWVNGQSVKYSEIPRNGTDRDNDNPSLPDLLNPERRQVQNPSSTWPEGSKVVPPGSVNCQGVAVQKVTINDLKPNRTYYVYFVITGTESVSPSAVEVYKFKTAPVTRPVISIAGDAATTTQPGRVNIRTDMGAELTYKVYSDARIRNMKYMGENVFLRDYLYPGRTLPSAYYTMTVYDALKEVYTYRKASQEGTDTNGYFPTDGTDDPSQFNKRYSVFDIYANETIKDDILAWLNADEESGPATQGGPKHVNANVSEYSERVIQANQTYYAIAMARKDPEDANTAQSDTGIRYSFMGNTINLSDENPPQLTGASGNFTVEDKNGRLEVTGGTITLTFNKRLTYDNGGTEPKLVEKTDTVNDLKNIFVPCIGINLDSDQTTVTNTNSGYTTITLAVTGPTVSASIPNGRLQNGSVAGSEGLMIVHSPTRWPDRNLSTEAQGFYFINVFWGANINQANENTARTIQGTGPGLPPDTAAIATSASGRVTTDSGSGNIQSGTLSVNFDKALYTDGTPVTKADLPKIINNAQGIDLSRSSVTNDTQNDTARINLALKKGAKNVSAKINSGAVTNSSGVATEEDLTITGTEKKTTNNQTGLTVSQYNLDVYWGDEKLNTITGSPSK